jgi:hypothetical protein
MVDEKESVENDEAKVDAEAKAPAKKTAGRPAKRTAAKPQPEADEHKDTATEDGEKESAVTQEATAPEGRVVPEGEEVNIKTREENGVEVAAENVYRKKLLPNSSRYTFILVAAEGTRIQ